MVSYRSYIHSSHTVYMVLLMKGLKQKNSCSSAHNLITYYNIHHKWSIKFNVAVFMLVLHFFIAFDIPGTLLWNLNFFFIYFYKNSFKIKSFLIFLKGNSINMCIVVSVIAYI